MKEVAGEARRWVWGLSLLGLTLGEGRGDQSRKNLLLKLDETRGKGGKR